MTKYKMVEIPLNFPTKKIFKMTPTIAIDQIVANKNVEAVPFKAIKAKGV